MAVGGSGVTVDSTKLKAKIKAVLALINADDMLDTIGQKELTVMGLVLQSAGSDGGGGQWKVMAPMTLAQNKPRSSDHHFASSYQQLLQQSGVSERTGANSVAVGTNAKYAPYHHFGGGRLPSRPLLPDEPTATKAAIEVIEAMLQKVSSVGKA